MHWDDPDYAPHSVASNEEGYRAEARAADADGDGDGEEAGEDEDEYYDASEAVDDQPKWKYDEWGEPYTSRTGLLDDDSASFDDGVEVSTEYDAEHGDYDDYDYDEAEDDTDAMLPFAIPDAAEFDRAWNEHCTANSLPDPGSQAEQMHRPPVEVGGGGRTLTHAEVWGDLALVHAHTAALQQYAAMHHLTPLPRKATSALWNDAPRYDSLLAQQVRADTQQILAAQRNPPISTATVAGHSAVVNDGEKTIAKGTKGAKGQQTRKVVTEVPHAHLSGNAAWQKAVKLVQNTPNHIGRIISQHTPPPTPTASTTAPEKPSDTEEQLEQDGDNELHRYWYAGYYAGLAAANGSANGTATGPASTSANGQDAPESDNIAI